ncbi:MAG TPA: hypothetical protein VNG51_26565 [Ktedonobacteraceae bacterium]|nr:hypothetical protein [Ktedonobacteraceae bacterium]
MPEFANEIACVQEKTNRAFEDLKTHSVDQVWGPVSSAIDKCDHLCPAKRQWLQYLIYARLDEMKCEAYIYEDINIAYIVHEVLPKFQKCGPPPENVIPIR